MKCFKWLPSSLPNSVPSLSTLSWPQDPSNKNQPSSDSFHGRERRRPATAGSHFKNYLTWHSLSCTEMDLQEGEIMWKSGHGALVRQTGLFIPSSRSLCLIAALSTYQSCIIFSRVTSSVEPMRSFSAFHNSSQRILWDPLSFNYAEFKKDFISNDGGRSEN